MAKFIVYRWHTGSKGVVKINADTNVADFVEHGQRQMRAQGLNDALTWKIHDGDFISAMVETTRI